MTPQETHAWLTDVLGPMELLNVNGMVIGSATVVPSAVSVGFGEVDNGLVVDVTRQESGVANAESAGTDIDVYTGPMDVRCEIICAAEGATAQQRVMAVAGAWNTLVVAGIPGQPGIALPGLVNDPELTVCHGILREPQIFDRGTPLVRESAAGNRNARMTLLLELILLTDDEYGIAASQGLDVMERRMHRRRSNLGDWVRG